MTFLELVKERYSCRKLKKDPIDDKLLQQIIEAAYVAPTSKNSQPFKIWVARSDDALKKVVAACKQDLGGSVAIVVGYSSGEAWVRPYDGHDFSENDAAIAATHIMMEIQDLGLAACWLGNFEPEKLRAEFPEMKDYGLIAVFQIGYPAEDAEPSPRHTEFRDRDEIIEVL
ncbi:MAG: nitroreductase family protein [Anaerovoracaceae bacterium]|jgi:nitroreductase